MEIFCELIISVRGGRCDYLPRPPESVATSLCSGIASTCVWSHRLLEGAAVVMECRVGRSLRTPRRFIQEYAV
jgi:hypothetical protein